MPLLAPWFRHWSEQQPLRSCTKTCRFGSCSVWWSSILFKSDRYLLLEMVGGRKVLCIVDLQGLLQRFGGPARAKGTLENQGTARSQILLLACSSSTPLDCRTTSEETWASRQRWLFPLRPGSWDGRSHVPGLCLRTRDMVAYTLAQWAGRSHCLVSL